MRTNFHVAVAPSRDDRQAASWRTSRGCVRTRCRLSRPLAASCSRSRAKLVRITSETLPLQRPTSLPSGERGRAGPRPGSLLWPSSRSRNGLDRSLPRTQRGLLVSAGRSGPAVALVSRPRVGMPGRAAGPAFGWCGARGGGPRARCGCVLYACLGWESSSLVQSCVVFTVR